MNLKKDLLGIIGFLVIFGLIIGSAYLLDNAVMCMKTDCRNSVVSWYKNSCSENYFK